MSLFNKLKGIINLNHIKVVFLWILFFVILINFISIPETEGPHICWCHQSNKSVLDNEQFSETTCSISAFKRGPNQKVISYVFYGDSNSKNHKTRRYFEGIKSNLELMKELYGSSWIMRLYYDLDPADQELMAQLCDLACVDPQLDLCNVRSLPGTPVEDASNMFAMNWRFFPTLDPQVDILLSRDLDSRISQREVDAVTEWLVSGRPVHVMRDHPGHDTPMLGGMWGTRLDEASNSLRLKWAKSWIQILMDQQTFAGRSRRGDDQDILARYIWPWARPLSLQHDSFL